MFDVCSSCVKKFADFMIETQLSMKHKINVIDCHLRPAPSLILTAFLFLDIASCDPDGRAQTLGVLSAAPG